MKLNKEFITYTTDSEQIMVATGSAAATFRGMARSNRTAAFIIDCLKEETSQSALVEKVLQAYDAPRDVVTRDVEKLLASLRTIGALDE